MRLKAGSKFRTPKYSVELEKLLKNFLGASISERRREAMRNGELGEVLKADEHGTVHVLYSGSYSAYPWPKGTYERYQRRVLRR